jgi:Domain of unknown function (DUF222)
VSGTQRDGRAEASTAQPGTPQPGTPQPGTPQPGRRRSGRRPPSSLTREEYRAAIAAGVIQPGDGEHPPPVGFGDGAEYDLLAPGPRLARLAADAAGPGQGCAGLDDEELVGVMCAWQRLAAWAQAGTAAAVTELAVRRAAQARDRGDTRDLDTHVRDEVAAALTLTGLSAIRLVDTSSAITRRLPDVYAALAGGRIDWARARVFADELSALDDDETARRIVADRLPDTPVNTTGQLRARLQRDVMDFDPAAAQARRELGRREARIEGWHEDSGNAALAGRELPAAQVIALFKQISATAEWLKSHGLTGSVNEVRAEVYLTLLAGRDPTTLLSAAAPADDNVADDAGNAAPADTTSEADSQPPSGDTRSAAPANASSPNGTNTETASPTSVWPPQLAGIINLTFPLSAWAGLTEHSGEVAGYGPTDADTCRDLASWAGTMASWCFTLTDDHGTPVAHACARGTGPPPGKPALRWAAGLRDELRYLESGSCSHARQTSGYRPPNNLIHLVKIRQRTCSFPGCRRAARFCDLDHTLAYDKGGITCECNLAPLCRRHHRAKQTFGWHLVQTAPGHLTWQLPHGRSYQTTGEPYPV